MVKLMLSGNIAAHTRSVHFRAGSGLNTSLSSRLQNMACIPGYIVSINNSEV